MQWDFTLGEQDPEKENKIIIKKMLENSYFDYSRDRL